MQSSTAPTRGLRATRHEPRATPQSRRAHCALGSSPGPEFFAANPALRAFIATSAASAHCSAPAHWPDSLPLVRIEDGGMAAQMAKCCLY